MPSTMTHSYIAKDIYNKLNDDLKKKFSSYLSNYITYSQGPDIFFFYPIIPPFIKSNHVRKFAGKVHRKNVNKFFISLVKDIKKTNDFEKFIYLAGLITHYAGDTICHPFVNYKAWVLEKETKKKKDYHFLVEAYIDNYVLNMKGEYYKTYKCYKMLNTKKNIKVETMLNKYFKEVFNEKNMGTNYYKGLANMKFLFYLIRYDPYKIKRLFYSIIYFCLPFLKRDIRYFSYNFDLTSDENEFFLNLNKETWFNIKKKDIKYNTSFLDLYKETVNKATFMIEKIYDYIYNNKDLDLERFFGNLSYANGLPIKSNQNKTTS